MNISNIATTMAETRIRGAVCVLAVLVSVGGDALSHAQAPSAAAAPPVTQGAGGGRGRGGGLPGATPEQLQDLAAMSASLSQLTSAAAAARNDLALATFASTSDAASISAAVEKLRSAELALAIGRASEFAKLQAGPNRLNSDQVSALIAAGGVLNAGRGGAPGAPTVPPGAGRGGRGN